MTGLMNALHKALDIFFLPFDSIAPFWGMLVVSAVTRDPNPDRAEDFLSTARGKGGA